MLGYGSGGTVVLSGEFDGRPVAVKRLLARFYDLARKEIDALIHVDDHPNVVCAAFHLVVMPDCLPADTSRRDTCSITSHYNLRPCAVQVRCFALERDSQFVYLALERCQCALADAVEPQAGSARPSTPLHLLRPDGGGPSPAAWAVAKDIGNGLLFLHERGFVHRDLKVGL